MSNLEVSINEVVDLKILVIITPRVEQGLSDLDPAKVADELEDGEVGEVDDRRVSEVRVAAVHDGRVDSVDDVGEKKYGKDFQHNLFCLKGLIC